MFCLGKCLDLNRSIFGSVIFVGLPSFIIYTILVALATLYNFDNWDSSYLDTMSDQWDKGAIMEV
jgi:hypothetical protein